MYQETRGTKRLKMDRMCWMKLRNVKLNSGISKVLKILKQCEHCRFQWCREFGIQYTPEHKHYYFQEEKNVIKERMYFCLKPECIYLKGFRELIELKKHLDHCGVMEAYNGNVIDMFYRHWKSFTTNKKYLVFLKSNILYSKRYLKSKSFIYCKRKKDKKRCILFKSLTSNAFDFNFDRKKPVTGNTFVKIMNQRKKGMETDILAKQVRNSRMEDVLKLNEIMKELGI